MRKLSVADHTNVSMVNDFFACPIHGYDYMTESCECWKCEEQVCDA